MQLLQLEVKNWVHHRHKVCTFTRGLVAILGENGSGKSSLFGAVRWLLTGENPNYGVKADNISQYAQPDEPAYAKLEFEHNGHFAVVTRHLRPDKEQSILTVDGKEVARGDKAVTAGIEKLLGVDAKFISRFVIVAQNEIFSFIDDNQTDTDKFFQRLFNTAKADKCQDVIGKSMAKISIPEIVQTPAQLKQQQDEIQKQIDALDVQISPLPSFESFLAAQKTDQATIAAWERREQAGKDLTRVLAQEVEYRQSLKTAEETTAQYESDFAALTDAANGQETAYAAARSALGHWQSYKNVAKAREGLQADREALRQSREGDPEPAPVPAAVLSSAQERQHTAQHELDKANKLLRVFSDDGLVACPTCHTPTANIADYLETTKASLPELLAAVEAAKEDLEAVQGFVDSRVAWEKRENERVVRAQQIADAETKLRAVAPPENTEDELHQTVNGYEEFQRVRQEWLPLVQEAREAKAKLSGALNTCVKHKEALENSIADIKVTQADAHLAQTRLAHYREQYGRRQELEAKKTQLVFDLQRLQEQYDAAVSDENKAAKLRTWTTIAETTREALKNAPRLVAQRNLQRLESAINELLQLFKMNFSVRVSNDGTPVFIAEFFDGRRQIAQRLSGGQKTVLALAFRFAVNAMFAEEIGLLALDEPTASLDQPRIQALAPVLERLRELSTARGLQCLLVTHAANLSHLFESTIELEAPELRHVQRNG